MKRISEFAVLLALLGLVACGGSSTADKTRPNNKPDDGQKTTELPDGRKGSVAAKYAVVPADFLRLSAVRLSPDNITAAVDISAEALIIPPVPEGIEFEYRWFVSNQEVTGVTDSTLKSSNFHKHQWVVCQARATAGKKVSGWLKSNWVRIANSPPQVEPIVLDNFNVPGQFHYQIKANDVDNDELTYELLAPLNEGIELDKQSGMLTWNLDNKIIEKLGDTIVISLSVSDNDAQLTTGSLTLRFQKKTILKNP